MILQGDSLELLKTLDDNSIDSVVTDPPYGLAFMGKKWDYNVPSVELWREVLRVLKPGGHLLSFGGTRTYHRMVVAIEDSGFEIRDQLQWLYGCLSEDTEVLTTNGWERYHTGIVNSRVLCYNIEDRSFAFDKPKRDFCYENQHTAYSIKSDKTDQIVSHNHRCIVERGGREVFKTAETLERKETLPVLESLHDLPDNIPDLYEGASVKKQNLLNVVQVQSSRPIGQSTKKSDALSKQQCSQKIRSTTAQITPIEYKGKVWCVEVSTGAFVARRNGKIFITGNSGFPKSMDISKAIDKAAGAKREVVGSRDVGPDMRGGNYENAEGRMIASITTAATDEARKWQGFGTALKPAFEPVVCARKPLPVEALIDNLVRDLLLKIGATLCQSQSFALIVKENLASSLSGSSEELNTAQWIAGSSTLTLADLSELMDMSLSKWMATTSLNIALSWKSTLDALLNHMSTFTTEMKTSLITDLKTLNCLPWQSIAATIIQDEKSQLGQNTNALLADNLFSAVNTKLAYIHTLSAQENATGKVDLSSLLQAEARTSNEPIVLARKPLSEKTVAKNVLRWGVGGLNIDQTRIGYQSEADFESAKGGNSASNKGGEFLSSKGAMKQADKISPQGRWPANLILDESAAELLDAQSGTSKSGTRKPNGKNLYAGNALLKSETKDTTTRGFTDSGGASRFFYVAKSSKSERNAGLEGMPGKHKKQYEGAALNKPEHISSDGVQRSGNRDPQQNHHPSRWGVGGLNIDGTRIGYGDEKVDFSKVQDGNIYGANGVYGKAKQKETTPLFKENGRWPSNVLLDETAAEFLDIQVSKTMKMHGAGNKKHGKPKKIGDKSMFGIGTDDGPSVTYDMGGEDSTKASRFFYVAKSSKKDRNSNGAVNNIHPTCKPTKLMQYLCRLVTPPGGTVLDPFAGSGTTGVAAKREGFKFVGIELESEYCDIARARIAAV